MNGVVLDDSGHGHSATLLEGASIGSEVPAFCVLADGDACTANQGALHLEFGQAAAISDAPGLRPDHLTIEAWIRPHRDAWVIVGKQLGDGCCSNSFQLELRDSAGGALNFFITDAGGGWHFALSSVIPPIDVWSHVAGTWDGQTMKLYLNGELIASAPFQGEIGYDGNPIIIGADDDGGGVPGCCYFGGDLDEVRLSDEALTPDEFVLICPEEECATPGRHVAWSTIKAMYR